MKVVKIVAPILGLILAVLVVATPIGPVPGFFIGGTTAETPATWPDTSSLHEVKLRVEGALPRVVIIWVVDVEGELYIVGETGGGWVSMIGNSAPVQVRVEDKTYSVTANLINEGWEPLMEAYVEKYTPDYPDIVAGFPTIEEAKGRISVFHLNRG